MHSGMHVHTDLKSQKELLQVLYCFVVSSIANAARNIRQAKYISVLETCKSSMLNRLGARLTTRTLYANKHACAFR